LGLAAIQPLDVEFELEADTPRLVGVEAAGEPLRISGWLDLRAAEVDLRLEAEGLPVELALPWLGEELFGQVSLPGSRIALTGSLGLRGAEFTSVAEARWIRGAEVVASVSLSSHGEPAAEEIPVEMSLELSPRAAGSRVVEARLSLPRASPVEGRVESGRLRLALPDLEGELARLRALWPAWIPELPAGLSTGPLSADGRFQGPLDDLLMQLEGKWTPAPDASLGLSCSGSIQAQQLEGHLAVDGFPVARLVEGAAGSLAGSIGLTLDGEQLAAELLFDGHDLGRGEFRTGRSRLAAAVDGRHVMVRELTVETTELNLRAVGEIELSKAPVADLGLELVGELGPISSAKGSLRLVDGKLLLEVPQAKIVDVSASLSVTAPLATLSKLPGAEALASLPLSGSDGPLEIEWDLPAVDWGPVVQAGESPDGESVRRWVLGSTGHAVQSGARAGRPHAGGPRAIEPDPHRRPARAGAGGDRDRRARGGALRRGKAAPGLAAVVITGWAFRGGADRRPDRGQGAARSR
jgi:hypothetical protein